jgi:hypothetical protein
MYQGIKCLDTALNFVEKRFVESLCTGDNGTILNIY